jgi:hypothetical protein
MRLLERSMPRGRGRERAVRPGFLAYVRGRDRAVRYAQASGAAAATDGSARVDRPAGGRRRAAARQAAWIAYSWLFKVAWEIPFDKPEKLRRRLHVHYPIRIDPAIGAGVPPGVRLQHALRDPPRLTALDYAMTGVYHALWLAPHVVLGWLVLRHPERVRASRAVSPAPITSRRSATGTSRRHLHGGRLSVRA